MLAQRTGVQFDQLWRLELLAKRKPKTRDSLHAWIESILGYHIPRTAVCDGHDAPFDFIADTYFGEVTRALILGARGTGKTLDLAISTLLKSAFHPGTTTAYYAAVGAQGQWGFGYLKAMLEPSHFQDNLEKNTAHMIKWDNGSWCRPGSGHTATGITAFRCNRLVVDEVDLWQPEMYETANYMVTASHTHHAERLVASTAYTSYGMMQALLAQARQRGFRVYKFCVVPETKVLALGGERRIDSLRAGDKVWAYGPAGFSLRSVVQCQRTRVQARIIKLSLSNGRTLRLTPDHPVLTALGWVEAGQLVPGQALVAADLTFSSGSSTIHKTCSGGNDEGELGQAVGLSGLWGQEASPSQAVPCLCNKVAAQNAPDPRMEREVPCGAGQGRAIQERQGSLPGNARQDERIGQAACGSGWGLERRKTLDRGGEGAHSDRHCPSAQRGPWPTQESNRHRANCDGHAGCSGGSVPISVADLALYGGLFSAIAQRSDRGKWRLLAQQCRDTGQGCTPRSVAQEEGNPLAGPHRNSDQAGCGKPDPCLVTVLATSVDGREDVWDCEVESDHTFIAEGVVLHNCIFEVMERCKACLEERCPLYVWENPRTGELEPLCRGRGLKADGFLPYEFVIDEFLATDSESYLVQKLLESPEKKALIYPRFDLDRHAATNIPDEILRHGKVGVGVDWGFDHPMALTVFAQTPNGKYWGIEEIGERFVTPARELELCQGLAEKYGPDIPFYCGQDQPKSIQMLYEHGLTVIPNLVRLRDDGHQLMRRLIDPNKGPLLKLDPKGMPNTMFQLSTLHRDDKGKEVQKDNDYADSARYCLGSAVESGGIAAGGGFVY